MPIRDYVTVVSGVPRSGTSLLMQMLAAGGLAVLSDAVRAPDPDNPRGYHEFEAVRRTREDPSWLVGATDHAVKVIHSLAVALPTDRAYRVLLMRRPWPEVLASQGAMLARKGTSPDDLPAERAVAVLEAELEALERWAAEAPRVALLRLDYPELIADPRRGAAEVARFLGGGLDVNAMAEAVDPSLYRQRSG